MPATPWLLILDNAEDAKIINKYLPQNPVGAILITCRSPFFASHMVTGAGKELPALKEGMAADLLEAQLTQNTGQKVDREEVLAVVRRVGCLPLGIQASIGLITESQCSLKDYLSQWSTPRALVRDSEAKHVFLPFARYDKGLSEVYSDLIERLDEDSRQMMETMALLDPDNIQEELFSPKDIDEDLAETGFIQNRVKCVGKLSAIGVYRNTTSDDLPSFRVHRVSFRPDVTSLIRSFFERPG